MRINAARLSSVSPVLVATACALAACACNVPRDPERTLEGIRGGTMRVGAIDHPPWVHSSGSEPTGVEAELAKDVAREVGAQIEWHGGAESALLEDLKGHRIDLVVGGLLSDTPWKKEIALTAPYYEEPDKQHVLAGPPGENAWLMVVEETIAKRRADVPRLLESSRSQGQ
jgi:polar amino acid transport system substrate-binding protein